MLPILKSKVFPYVLLGVTAFGMFTMWQGKREVTKQLEEKTQQLEHIMANPDIRTIEGPVKIVKGKTIVKTVIKEVRVDGSETTTETETITDPTITEKGPSVTETVHKDPILEGEVALEKVKRKGIITGSYNFDQTASLGVGMIMFQRLTIGTQIIYNIKDRNLAPGVVIGYLF